MERAERVILLCIGLLFDSHPDPDPVGDAGAHRRHRRPALRRGVEPGGGRTRSCSSARPPGAAAASPAARPGPIAAPSCGAGGPARSGPAVPVAPRARRLPGRLVPRPHAAAAAHVARWPGRPARPWPGSERDRRAMVDPPHAPGARARRPPTRPSDRAVDGAFESYAAYWLESFRLPSLSAADGDGRLRAEGYRPRRATGLAAGKRRDPGPAPPRRLGVGRAVDGRPGPPDHGGGRAARAARAVRVVRRAPGVARHDGGAPRAGRRAARCCGRCGPTRSCACCPTAIIGGGGVQVTFFGEDDHACRPARPRSRCAPGAPVLPTAVYFTGARDGHLGVVRPPLTIERTRTAARRRGPVHPGAGDRARGPDPPGARAVAPVPAELAERPGIRPLTESVGKATVGSRAAAGAGEPPGCPAAARNFAQAEHLTAPQGVRVFRLREFGPRWAIGSRCDGRRPRGAAASAAQCPALTSPEAGAIRVKVRACRSDRVRGTP